MPYIDVAETNCLYVAGDEKEARFKKQCEIIKEWQSHNLSAHDLIGVSTGFTEKELKKAKMKIFFHFHPDKNNNSLDSTKAFQILSDAVEFLAHQLDSSIDLSNNIFANKEPVESPQKTRQTSQSVKAYAAKLRELAQSGQMTRADEEFFRKALTEHPEYLPLVINELNLFHVVLDKGGSSDFFQWLINQRYAKETLSKFNVNQDVFSYAFDANRKDCLKILFDAYGIEGFHASSIAYSLSLCVQMSEDDERRLDTFWFLMNDLNYVPRSGYIAVSVLDQALETADLATFNRIYEKFKHLLLETEQSFTHNSLICKVLTFVPATAKIKLQKMADAGLMHHITDPLFQNAPDLISFLSHKNAPSIIQDLQTKHNLMKNIGSISSEMIHQLSHASVIILLNLGLISVEDVLSNAKVYDLYHDRNRNGAISAFELTATLKDKNQEAFTRWYSTLNTKIDDPTLVSFGNSVVINLLKDGILSVERILPVLGIERINKDNLLSQAILQQDRSAFHAWLKGIKFTPEYLKSTVGQSHLSLMLKYEIVFTEQQLNIIQSTFDGYFTALAEKRLRYRADDYRFLPQTTEAWLPILIECIGKSPNRMACLNKLYKQEVRVVVQADTHRYYRVNDSTFSTYEYTETILSSFTPLQFFMIMDKKPLAVLLLSQGVDWKQSLRATTQTGINNPSHYAYNPHKRIREFEIKINSQYVEERLVKVLSSDPDAETQKRIIDSKEIIFIHKNGQIEIGFCNTDYEYEQKVVSGVPNIIDAVGRAKSDKITNSADLDAIERYMAELGICLYSSEHTESTVLDFVKTEIQNTEESRLKDQRADTNSATDWNNFYDDRSQDVKAALKQIQLNEAESYLYKRTLDADYKTKMSFFGVFTIINFGFSKKEKVTAVRALINFLKNDTPIPESCKPALYQGELGKIAMLRDIVFEPEHPQVNSSGLSHNP